MSQVLHSLLSRFTEAVDTIVERAPAHSSQVGDLLYRSQRAFISVLLDFTLIRKCSLYRPICQAPIEQPDRDIHPFGYLRSVQHFTFVAKLLHMISIASLCLWSSPTYVARHVVSFVVDTVNRPSLSVCGRKTYSIQERLERRKFMVNILPVPRVFPAALLQAVPRDVSFLVKRFSAIRERSASSGTHTGSVTSFGTLSSLGLGG